MVRTTLIAGRRETASGERREGNAAAEEGRVREERRVEGRGGGGGAGGGSTQKERRGSFREWKRFEARPIGNHPGGRHLCELLRETISRGSRRRCCRESFDRYDTGSIESRYNVAGQCLPFTGVSVGCRDTSGGRPCPAGGKRSGGEGKGGLLIQLLPSRLVEQIGRRRARELLSRPNVRTCATSPQVKLSPRGERGSRIYQSRRAQGARRARTNGSLYA